MFIDFSIAKQQKNIDDCQPQPLSMTTPLEEADKFAKLHKYIKETPPLPPRSTRVKRVGSPDNKGSDIPGFSKADWRGRVKQDPNARLKGWKAKCRPITTS